MKKTKKMFQEPCITAVDLFCGAGGLTYGLEKSGISVKFGVDLDPACKYPLEKNSKAKFKCRDIKSIQVEELKEWLGHGISLLAGCAPCQPFSTYSNTRKGMDERWALLKEFQRLVEGVQPTIITVENVPGLSQQEIWKEFVMTLERNNYFVSWSIVNALNFGVPQTRRRVVLLASKLGPIEIGLPKKHKIQTVREAIIDLPLLLAGEKNANDQMHVAANLSEINMKRIKASIPGRSWRDWPVELRAKCHQKETGKTYPSVYGRMEWDKPSPTITTQCYGYGNGRFGHPEQNRAISLREAAILQSFPKKYKFTSKENSISFTKIGTLIGNAVPPKLSLHLGGIIFNHVASCISV